ncbi:MAG: hypothetical protein ACO2ZM_09205 [Francisellaceae bacterium]
MLIFLIYAIVLAFFWIKTLISVPPFDEDDKIAAFLALKYRKIMRYKQFALLYICELVYLVVISMVSANYMPKAKVITKGTLDAFLSSINTLFHFPWWLQLLFYLALIGFIIMLFLPIIFAFSHRRAAKEMGLS